MKVCVSKEGFFVCDRNNEYCRYCDILPVFKVLLPESDDDFVKTVRDLNSKSSFYKDHH